MKSKIPNSCIIVFAFLIFLSGCHTSAEKLKPENLLRTTGDYDGTSRKLPPDFGDYWFEGKAEISSFKLKQARYGEFRDGHAVLIYVTEPFLPEKQVKADENHADNIQVLKLNRVKKFITGIYPYSIMTSIFYPVFHKQHAIKLSASVQEWCGHVYTQLNNRKTYEVASHSYFEQEGDQHLQLEKSPLEDELWTQIRIDPNALPTGSLEIIPSLEYIRLRHKVLKAYPARASLSTNGTISSYELTYPGLERTLRIEFEPTFPFTIERWTDTYKSGFGPDAVRMETTAERIKTLKTAYWTENGNKDVILRDSLGL